MYFSPCTWSKQSCEMTRAFQKLHSMYGSTQYGSVFKYKYNDIKVVSCNVQKSYIKYLIENYKAAYLYWNTRCRISIALVNKIYMLCFKPRE